MVSGAKLPGACHSPNSASRLGKTLEALKVAIAAQQDFDRISPYVIHYGAT